MIWRRFRHKMVNRACMSLYTQIGRYRMALHVLQPHKTDALFSCFGYNKVKSTSLTAHCWYTTFVIMNRLSTSFEPQSFETPVNIYQLTSINKLNSLLGFAREIKGEKSLFENKLLTRSWIKNLNYYVICVQTPIPARPAASHAFPLRTLSQPYPG